MRRDVRPSMRSICRKATCWSPPPNAAIRYWAQIDRGTFALDREPSGLDVILQELIETVEAARDSLVVFDCRPAWRPYEERIGPERIRTRMNDDELYDIQNEWYQKWYDEGADVHRLTPKPDDMPEDLYRRFCETAEGDDAWVDTEYNYLNTAVITTKYYDNVNKTGPLLSTRWIRRLHITHR